ncbi:MAG: thiol reductant ABC exporter subunit CydD [Acidimicrobiia bacterium]
MTTRAVDIRLMERGRGALPMLVATVASGVATALLVLGQAVILASIINRVFLGKETLTDVSGNLLQLALLFVARALTVWIRQVFAARAAVAVKRSLRRDLIAAVLRRGTRAGDAGGELVVQVVQGVDALDPYFARYLPELILGAIVPLVGVIWVATIDRLSAGILLVTVPLIPVFMILIGSIADEQTAKRWRRLQSLAGAFQTMVRGMTVLRVFGRTRDWLERLQESSEDLRRETMATLRIAFLSALVLELIATISTALVAVAVGIRVVYGQIDFQPAFTVLIIAPEIYLPLRRVGAEFHAAMEGVKASGSAFDLIAQEQEPTGAIPAPDAATSTITLDRVSAVSGGRTLLADLSLQIEPGEFVALVGESGAGKTTLLRLLMGFAAPAGGRISVGGIDLSEVELRGWWDQISYLPQEPFFRSGSIRDNVQLADPHASDARLWHALDVCGLADFVKSLPQGLDTGVGEGAKLLSAGQRRRLALARAFVRRSPIVLLDEPTANVDATTRAVLGSAIKKLNESGTVIAVLHDREMADLADRCIEVTPE